MDTVVLSSLSSAPTRTSARRSDFREENPNFGNLRCSGI